MTSAEHARYWSHHSLGGFDFTSVGKDTLRHIGGRLHHITDHAADSEDDLRLAIRLNLIQRDGHILDSTVTEAGHRVNIAA